MKEVKIWSKIFIILGVLCIIADLLIGFETITLIFKLEYATIKALNFTFKSFALITILISYAMHRIYKIFEYQENKIKSSEKRIKTLEDKINIEE